MTGRRVWKETAVGIVHLLMEHSQDAGKELRLMVVSNVLFLLGQLQISSQPARCTLENDPLLA
jgi:hypothetical protein